MFRVRVLPISVAMALAVGAITCAPASAIKEFSVENKAVGVTAQFYRGMTIYPYGVGFLEATMSATRVGIICNVVQYDGFFEKEGKIKGKNRFSSCYLDEISGRKFAPTNCGVEPFIIKFTGKLTEKAEIEQAEDKALLGTITITVCGIKGTYEIKGKEFCSFPWSAVESPLHGWICGSTGGDIKTAKEGGTMTEAKFIYFTTIMVPNATFTGFLSWGII